MLISITDQSKKKRKEYAKRKRPGDKVWVGQNPPKLEFGWVSVPFGRLIHTKPASKFPKVPKIRTTSHACLFPNWKRSPGIRFQFFSAGAKPTSPSPFNEGLIVLKPVTQRQQYLTVQVPFQLFLLCLWIIWGFDITNTRHSVSTHLKHLLNNMENFKELQGFSIHIPIQKTYCPVYDRGIFRNSSIKRRTPIERWSRKNSRSKLPIFKLTNRNQKLLGRRFVDS